MFFSCYDYLFLFFIYFSNIFIFSSTIPCITPHNGMTYNLKPIPKIEQIKKAPINSTKSVAPNVIKSPVIADVISSGYY